MGRGCGKRQTFCPCLDISAAAASGLAASVIMGDGVRSTSITGDSGSLSLVSQQQRFDEGKQLSWAAGEKDSLAGGGVL